MVVTVLLTCAEDLDLELRLARFEELMDRRPFLLSRYVCMCCQGLEKLPRGGTK